jgi:hypothetical protein
MLGHDAPSELRSINAARWPSGLDCRHVAFFFAVKLHQ